VGYCNENSIEFLAINRRHDWTQSLGSFNGIRINLASLDSIKIQPIGKSAWFGGGAYGGQTTRYLWSRGYVTTTGMCDCIGIMGPGLGAGHGRHEGLYGMISDNIVQMNVVLADGRTVRVSKKSYSDLLWAMKGAGHNFGIVTSFELNIFPRGLDTWHYQNYIWRGDKLDAVFDTLNKFHNNGKTPVDMALNMGYFYMNTTITNAEPVIYWTFAYSGSAKAAQKHLKAFDEIGVAYKKSGDVPYPVISLAQKTDENNFFCQHGYGRVTSTAGLQMYNIASERQVFDAFTKRVANNPALAAAGILTYEGYSTKAVQAHDPNDSA
ncbi:FAD-binding domain-containing protein, partial [Colletotrichum somersetense]